LQGETTKEEEDNLERQFTKLGNGDDNQPMFN